uniref:Zgc:112185 n=2 Tax=Sinocyclocheilus rhinocerous TaxID=307959 RepID=A0A673G2P8_9TELE
KTRMARVARTLKTAAQNADTPANAKKLKKKKKKAGDGKGPHLQTLGKRNPHFLIFLHICLHLGEDASRALKTLRSSKAPLVKKRQVMRAISGDYRKKIEEERARQFKLIQSAMTSARLTSVSECKPVFHRRAERNTQPTNKTDRSQETHTLQGPRETIEHTNTDGDTKSFVFTKTHEEFRFNFNL